MASLGRMAIKAGMDRLFEVYGTEAVQGVSENLLGVFLAVYAFQYGKHKKHLSDDQVVRVIKHANLKVRVESSGRVTASVLRDEASRPVAVGGRRGGLRGLRHISRQPSVSPKEESQGQQSELQTPVTIQNKQGTSIYIIQKLNVYLSADVVQQLNINPQQVINKIQDQIEKEIEKCR